MYVRELDGKSAIEIAEAYEDLMLRLVEAVSRGVEASLAKSALESLAVAEAHDEDQSLVKNLRLTKATLQTRLGNDAAYNEVCEQVHKAAAEREELKAGIEAIKLWAQLLAAGVR